MPTSDCIEKNNMPITHNAVVYDAHGRVIIESLRQSEFAAIKHVSDTYIDSNTVCCNTINEDAVYCGHFFGHFGHFLLETRWCRHKLLRVINCLQIKSFNTVSFSCFKVRKFFKKKPNF